MKGLVDRRTGCVVPLEAMMFYFVLAGNDNIQHLGRMIVR